MSLGGWTKQEPADFQVEELLAYEPEGRGEHLYLWVEKEGLTTFDLVRKLERALGVRDIGVAGLKDKIAITRQFLSVPATCEPALAGLDLAGVRILSATRHPHKLRSGHVFANRFRVRVRGAAAGALDRALAQLAGIEQQGFANAFGEQRFGHEDKTVQLGLEILRAPGGRLPRGHPGWDKRRRRLALSSVQSLAFNQTLTLRQDAGCLREVIPGDVLVRAPGGRPFLVDDLGDAAARLARREVTPAGPIHGPKMLPAAARAAEFENLALAALGLSGRDFEHGGKLTLGTRRANLVFPAGLAARALEPDVELTFELPAGSYATVLLAELGVSAAGDQGMPPSSLPAPGQERT